MDQSDGTWGSGTFEVDGAALTVVGISFTTHEGRVEWELRPTNPTLKAGDPLPDVVYGDVRGPRVDGEARPNNRTYARWDVAAGTVTFGARSLDPGV